MILSVVVEEIEASITQFEQRDVGHRAHIQRAAVAEHVEVREALTVARAIACGTVMPTPNNFDMQLGKSMTPLVGLLTFQSVENVPGHKPACMMRSATSHLNLNMTDLPVADVEPDATAAFGRHLGKDAAVVVDDAAGPRREHVGEICGSSVRGTTSTS